jgi:two-component system, NarL family, response regulator DevR
MIRIAIIDDDKVVREGLRVMLQDEPDFEIGGEGSSAVDIVDFVSQTRPDVVLIAARLPGIFGPEVVRLLAETHPEVKVIILTVYVDRALVDESIRAGVRGYIFKDVERFDLKRAIRAVAKGESVLSPWVAILLKDRLRAERQPAGGVAPPSALNERQTQILQLISDGYSNGEIAERIHVSEDTVKRHIQQIFAKLEVPMQRILVRLSDAVPAAVGFTLMPEPPMPPRAPADRLTEMEHRLSRIAAELRAAGVMDDIDRLPNYDEFPQLTTLSSRQWQILVRLLRGERVSTIALDLFLSPRTVRNHLAAIFVRFDVHSQAELIALLKAR